MFDCPSGCQFLQMNMKIQSIQGRVIKDSAGKRALEARLGSGGKIFASSVGQGASRGKNELRQDDAQPACLLIRKIVASRLKNRSILSQRKIDEIIFDLLTQEKIGVNTALAVSQALAKASAFFSGKPVWRYLASLFDFSPSMPISLAAIVEGGKHNRFDQKPAIQEYLIAGGVKTIARARQTMADFFERDKIQFSEGSEGGWAPATDNDQIILNQLELIKKKLDCPIGIDAAAEHQTKKININAIADQYPLDLIEDPYVFDETQKWTQLWEKFCDRKIIIGDDLTVTNPQKIISSAKLQMINGVIIKPNQAGTITRTFEAIASARRHNLKIIVSHRGQETKDDILADIAVAAGADFIKIGCPFQAERKAKYDRLNDINSELF